MYKFIIAFIFVFCSNVLLAQLLERRDMVWHWGYENAPQMYGGNKQLEFNFKGDSLRVDTGVFPLKFHITYSSVCDTNGNLLLYTNGVSIANGNHEIIEDGDSLNLHWQELIGYEGLEKFLAQGALFLPNPANNGIYYLFHEEYRWLLDWTLGFNRFSIKKIYLTTIDMNANGGAGKVIERNKVIVERDSLMDRGRILSVRHANGRDWWVVIPQYQSDRLSRFLVTPEGVLPQPDIVIEQFMYPAGDPEQAAFSPDGTKYALPGGNVATQERYFYLFDFDRCTGNLYNMQVKKPESPWLWGVFFSPDSRFLYWIHESYGDVTQFDLTDPNWYNDGIRVYEWDNLWQPTPTVPIYGWNAPDGRIYMSCGNGVTVYHRINRPNKKGVECAFERNIEIPTLNYVTLPNFPNYRLGPLDGSPCDTLGLDNNPVAWWRYEPNPGWVGEVEFLDLSYHEPATWHWDFGDGNTSAAQNPFHLFTYTDTFEVCLTVTNVHGTNTHCKPLVVGTVSGVEETAANANGRQIKVVPNPAKDKVSFLAPGVSSDAMLFVQVLDLNGKTVKEMNIRNGEVITHTFLPGLYFCRVHLGEEPVHTVKFIIIP